MSGPVKTNIEEQLALYRLRKKKEEESQALKQRLWQTVYIVLALIGFGNRSDSSSSSLATDSEKKSDQGSEEIPEVISC